MSSLSELLRQSIEGHKTKTVERGPVGPAKKQFVTITTASGEFLKNFDRGARDLRTGFRRVVRLGRQMIAQEFSREAHRTQGNSFRRWPKTRDFGTKSGPSKTLQRSRRLVNAWAGKGESFTTISRTGAKWGVRVPYAEFVRRGSKQVVTAKQRVFLGTTFGVWMRPGGTIIVPARPHAELEGNRAYLEDAGFIIAAFMTGATRAQLESARGKVAV